MIGQGEFVDVLPGNSITMAMEYYGDYTKTYATVVGLLLKQVDKSPPRLHPARTGRRGFTLIGALT